MRIGWENRSRLGECSVAPAWCLRHACNLLCSFSIGWVGSVNIFSCSLHLGAWRASNSGFAYVIAIVSCTSWHKEMCWAAEERWGHHWVMASRSKEPKKAPQTFTAPIWNKKRILHIRDRFDLVKCQIRWISFGKGLVFLVCPGNPNSLLQTKLTSFMESWKNLLRDGLKLLRSLKY